MRPMALDNLARLKGGLNKRWIWKDSESFHRGCDYFQKIGYCIQDLNTELGSIDNATMKDVVFVIVLIDWISEAVNALPTLLKDGLYKGFSFQKQAELDSAAKYLKAMRSFVVAHPLSTDRHKKFGFDGGKICVDVRSAKARLLPLLQNEIWSNIDHSGLHNGKSGNCVDFVLLIYDKEKDEMKYFKCIEANFSDLYRVAELYIEKIFAIDKYLIGLKKKDWDKKNEKT